jgi:hypothetical protein
MALPFLFELSIYSLVGDYDRTASLANRTPPRYGSPFFAHRKVKGRSYCHLSIRYSLFAVMSLLLMLVLCYGDPMSIKCLINFQMVYISLKCYKDR